MAAGKRKKSKGLLPPWRQLRRFLDRSRGRYPADADYAHALRISAGRLSQLTSASARTMPPSTRLARQIESTAGVPFSAWFPPGSSR